MGVFLHSGWRSSVAVSDGIFKKLTPSRGMHLDNELPISLPLIPLSSVEILVIFLVVHLQVYIYISVFFSVHIKMKTSAIILAASALFLSKVIACPGHDYNASDRLRRRAEPGGNTTWAYEASYDWGRLDDGKPYISTSEIQYLL